MSKRIHILVLLIMLLAAYACTQQSATQLPIVPTQPNEHDVTAVATAITEILPSPATLTVQPDSDGEPDSLGPNLEDFPEGYNPLTGKPVADPSLLKTPALLVSISHFPATARPQAGLSFAPYVFEFSITEGATRFLTTFYGEFPRPEIPVKGDCPLRTGEFGQTNLLLGNQVWLDENGDGIQSPGEGGIGGICVNLYDASGSILRQTATDSNGYYGFNIEPGHYIVEVLKPNWLNFTKQNIGDDKADSDADQTTGRMEADVSSSLLDLDSGLIPSSEVTPTPDPSAVMPKAQVGPVRSGRLLYAYIGAFFQDSCLIYAFASEEVLAQIPKCSFVAHEVQGGGFMLGIDRMHAIAEDNARKTHTEFNYASNLYTGEPPAGGVPASQIYEHYALLNQSGWKYDPLYQGWLRYVDTSKPELAGVLHPEVDRLTGRQLHFENIIVIFAEHEVVSPTNLNIHLDQGNIEPALLFRDGKMYQIKWSTMAGEYEKKTGLRRPIQFLNLDGTPAALKPGHTWVMIVTDFSTVKEESSGVWKVTFYPPEGSK